MLTIYFIYITKHKYETIFFRHLTSMTSFKCQLDKIGTIPTP